VIRDYGEERFAGAIAKAIVARRTEHGPITRTTELATLVAAAVKTREKGQNPATRTFRRCGFSLTPNWMSSRKA
jgi:16S rRNA (cytosine1402-N4)-methyltransferase